MQVYSPVEYKYTFILIIRNTLIEYKYFITDSVIYSLEIFL